MLLPEYSCLVAITEVGSPMMLHLCAYSVEMAEEEDPVTQHLQRSYLVEMLTLPVTVMAEEEGLAMPRLCSHWPLKAAQWDHPSAARSRLC